MAAINACPEAKSVSPAAHQHTQFNSRFRRALNAVLYHNWEAYLQHVWPADANGPLPVRVVGALGQWDGVYLQTRALGYVTCMLSLRSVLDVSTRVNPSGAPLVCMAALTARVHRFPFLAALAHIHPYPASVAPSVIC